MVIYYELFTEWFFGEPFFYGIGVKTPFWNLYW